MANESRARVLLGNPGPIMRVGMSKLLSEDGCRVVDQDDHRAPSSGLPTGCVPTIAVLDLDGGSSYALAQLVRGASPESTVVLWAREEDLIEVLEPASSAARLIAGPVIERLRGELSGQHVHE